MSRDDLEREVNDYLDGRLSVPERHAFEKRLHADPELARRLESYDAVRRALRETTVDPPPGFYARARARFEERRPVTSPWRRLASWEAVGLAATALLVFAILFPRPPAAPRAPAASESRPVPLQIEGAAVPGAAEPEVENAIERPVRKSAVEPAPRPEEESVAGRAEVAEDWRARELGTLGYLEKDETDETSRVLGAVQAERHMEPPSAGEEREFAAAPSAARNGPTDDRRWGTPLPEGFFDSPAPRSRAEVDREVIVIDNPEAWDRVRGNLRFDDLVRDLSANRLVLIGPRPEPIDCKALRWLRVEQGIVIELAAVAVSVPSPGGCALWIPAGNEPVTFRQESP